MKPKPLCIIREELSELLIGNLNTDTKIGDLLINTLDETSWYLSKDFSIKTSEDGFKMKYPEPFTAARRRYETFFKKLTKSEVGESEAVVCVSHGNSLEGLL